MERVVFWHSWRLFANNVKNMFAAIKRVLIYLIILSLSACKEDKCNYGRAISVIKITHWDSRKMPKHCMVYTYKLNSDYSKIIDSLQIDNIRRGYDDSTSLLCIPDKEKLNYQYDISIILDDTLIFNISQFKLSWVKDGRQWGGIGGPMEYCIVSSVNVNGYTSNDTTKAGELAFSHNFIKTKKR